MVKVLSEKSNNSLKLQKILTWNIIYVLWDHNWRSLYKAHNCVMNFDWIMALCDLRKLLLKVCMQHLSSTKNRQVCCPTDRSCLIWAFCLLDCFYTCIWQIVSISPLHPSIASRIQFWIFNSLIDFENQIHNLYLIWWILHTF